MGTEVVWFRNDLETDSGHQVHLTNHNNGTSYRKIHRWGYKKGSNAIILLIKCFVHF